MIGDLWNNNKKKDVCTREDQRMFMGHKYRREAGTGYYVCTTGDRKRLHVAMWEHEAGRCVPPGCVVHHLDWNKEHNEVDNLVCVSVEEHERIHNIIGGEKGKALGYEIKNSRGYCIPGGDMI